MSDNIVRLPYTAQEIQELLKSIPSQWTKKYLVYWDPETFETNQSKYADLSSYLPNDSNCYEVNIRGWYYPSSGSKNPEFLYSDLSSDLIYLIATPNPDAPTNMLFSTTVFVGQDHKIRFFTNENSVAGNLKLRFHGYRRIKAQ